MQGVEHTIATIIDKWTGLCPIKDLCQFSKKVRIVYLRYCFELKPNLILPFYKLCNIFGNTHHAPYVVFAKASKNHNNGKKLELVKPSDCGIGSEAIQLLRLLWLKNALTECVASKAFQDLKQFAIVGEVLLHEGFWDLLWYVCKALYPMYHLLRLANMKIGGINKVKYYMHQIEHLLPTSIDGVFEKWDSGCCPALKLKLACVSNLEFDLPKNMGGWKITGLEKGIVLLFVATCSRVLLQFYFFDR
jgi:hypothetical protein